MCVVPTKRATDSWRMHLVQLPDVILQIICSELIKQTQNCTTLCTLHSSHPAFQWPICEKALASHKIIAGLHKIVAKPMCRLWRTTMFIHQQIYHNAIKQQSTMHTSPQLPPNNIGKFFALVYCVDQTPKIIMYCRDCQDCNNISPHRIQIHSWKSYMAVGQDTAALHMEKTCYAQLLDPNANRAVLQISQIFVHNANLYIAPIGSVMYNKHGVVHTNSFIGTPKIQINCRKNKDKHFTVSFHINHCAHAKHTTVTDDYADNYTDHYASPVTKDTIDLSIVSHHNTAAKKKCTRYTGTYHLRKTRCNHVQNTFTEIRQ